MILMTSLLLLSTIVTPSDMPNNLTPAGLSDQSLINYYTSKDISIALEKDISITPEELKEYYSQASKNKAMSTQESTSSLKPCETSLGGAGFDKSVVQHKYLTDEEFDRGCEYEGDAMTEFTARFSDERIRHLTDGDFDWYYQPDDQRWIDEANRRDADSYINPCISHDC